MKPELVKVTPAMALEWLKVNYSNRPLTSRHVQFLADEMRAGRWKFNGDTICFADKGKRLIDGQHRLHAVVLSECTIECLVIWDLPEDVFDTKDVGKRRSFGDMLSVSGEKYASDLPSVLLFVDRVTKGKLMVKHGKISHQEVADMLEKYPDTRASVQFCKGKCKFAPLSTVAGLHYLFGRKDGVMASLFFDALFTGENMKSNDPIYILRERLLRNASDARKLPAPHVAALIVKTWNAVRENRGLRQLKFNDDEIFPAIE